MDPCQSKCRHPILRWSYPPVTVLFTAVFHVEWKCYYYPLTTLLCVAENVNNKKNLALPNLPNRQFSVWQTGYKKRRFWVFVNWIFKKEEEIYNCEGFFWYPSFRFLLYSFILFSLFVLEQSGNRVEVVHRSILFSPVACSSSAVASSSKCLIWNSFFAKKEQRRRRE